MTRRVVAMGVAVVLGASAALAGTAAVAAPAGTVLAVPLAAEQSPLHATGTTTGQVSQLLSPVLDERVGVFARHAIAGTGTPVPTATEPEAILERVTPAGPVSGELCDASAASCEDATRWRAISGALSAGGATARTTATADALRAESSIADATIDLATLFPQLSTVTGISEVARVGGASADVQTGRDPILIVNDVEIFGETPSSIDGVLTRSQSFSSTDPVRVLQSILTPAEAVEYAPIVQSGSIEGEVTVTVEQPEAVAGRGAALRLTVSVDWDLDVLSPIGTIDANVAGELLVIDLGGYVLDAETAPVAELQAISTVMRTQHSEVPANGLITGGYLADQFNGELADTSLGGDDLIEWGAVGTPETDPGEKSVFVEEEAPVDGLSFTRVRGATTLDAEGAEAAVDGTDVVVTAPLVAEDGLASAVFGLDEVIAIETLTTAAGAARDLSGDTSASVDATGLRVLGESIELPAPGQTVTVTVETVATDMDAAITALFGEEILLMAPGLAGNLEGTIENTVTAAVTAPLSSSGGTADAALEVVLSATSEMDLVAAGAARPYLERMQFTSEGEFARVTLGSVQAGRDGSLVEPVVPQEPGEQPDTEWAIPTAAPSRILLSATETPETSIAVTWRTDDSIETGLVEVRPAAAAARVTAETRTIEAVSEDVTFATWGYVSRSHSATIDELDAATRYEYRVGAGEDWSPWASFTTAAESGSFTFLGFGDAQNDLTPGFTPVAQMAFEDVPEAAFALHAGDLINNSDNDVQWAEWFRAQESYTATVPTITTPGNHEYSGDQALSQYRAHVEQPRNGPRPTATDAYTRAFETAIAEHLVESAFYVDYQGVRVISLDDNVTSGLAEYIPREIPECTLERCETAMEVFLRLQGDWLDQVLTENPHHWSIVTFHQPIFSTSEGRDNKPVRDAWLPIIEKHNVDLVLNGHDHSYGRGHLIENETETPGLSTGPVYAVSVSGPKMYELSPADDNVWTQNGARQVTRAGDTQGYQVIEVTDEQIHYRSIVALKQDGSTVTEEVGETFDEFTITKYADGTKWVTEAGVDVPADTSGPGETPSPTPSSDPDGLPATGGPRADVLPMTGVDIAASLATALVLAGLGLALLFARRRRQA